MGFKKPVIVTKEGAFFFLASIDVLIKSFADFFIINVNMALFLAFGHGAGQVDLFKDIKLLVKNIRNFKSCNFFGTKAESERAINDGHISLRYLSIAGNQKQSFKFIFV